MKYIITYKNKCISSRIKIKLKSTLRNVIVKLHNTKGEETILEIFTKMNNKGMIAANETQETVE